VRGLSVRKPGSSYQVRVTGFSARMVPTKAAAEKLELSLKTRRAMGELVGSRQAFWFSLTDDMLDLDEGTMPIPAELSKNKCDHRICLTSYEVALFREQLLEREPGTRLVFPTATCKQWDRSRFREQVWTKALAAAVRRDVNIRTVCRRCSRASPSTCSGTWLSR
jgi:hypothetical protein